MLGSSEVTYAFKNRAIRDGRSQAEIEYEGKVTSPQDSSLSSFPIPAGVSIISQETSFVGRAFFDPEYGVPTLEETTLNSITESEMTVPNRSPIRMKIMMDLTHTINLLNVLNPPQSSNGPQGGVP
jgi:hypothetical protein